MDDGERRSDYRGLHRHRALAINKDERVLKRKDAEEKEQLAREEVKLERTRKRENAEAGRANRA